MNSPAPDHRAAAALADLVAAHDKLWCGLDFVGLARLWEHDDPRPVYLGDEYPGPLIGADELDRHWARLAGRVTAASVVTTVHALDVLDGDLARAVLLTRWRLSSRGPHRDSDLERAGASWITWLLVGRDGRYRIFHQMESAVYLPD